MPAIDPNDECNKAIAAHAKWKTTFKKMLAGEVSVDSATARRPDVCEFGKWLMAGGRAFLMGKHASVDAAHRHFHSVAAAVIDAHNSGRKQDVERSLAVDGDFSRAGSTLVGLIMEARRKP
jgi:hypothetical protein